MKIGPKYKIARRLGDRIFPKTQTSKFTISGTEKRVTSKRGRRGNGEYGAQLIEKQKARYTYGVSEKQFSNYVKKSRTKKGSNPASELSTFLESRLDNTVFRLGLVKSRQAARQAVSHGHIMVNGRRTRVPSYSVKAGDKITVRPESRASGLFRDLSEKMKEYTVPAWLSYDEEKWTGTVMALPQVLAGESTLNFSSILEFYSRV
jgi:small subunit ribosomal protein S4